jgi:hypothetical protein
VHTPEVFLSPAAIIAGITLSLALLCPHCKEREADEQNDESAGSCSSASTSRWQHGLSRCPFFLVELLRISLARVDWHRVAANVLEIPHVEHSVCHCATMGGEGGAFFATAEYLGEVFMATGNRTMELSEQLPEPERTQALPVADLCRQTTQAMRLFLSDGETR